MRPGTADSGGRPSLSGRMIAGKYLVRERLGGGAMGEVYRARQVALERDVAVKVIHPRLARDREFSDRFQREALTTSGFSHPNSIAVTDYGEEPDGLLYLVMEFVPGKSLEQLVADDGPLPEARAVEILSQMLAALAAAHDMGIVHRDLKPDNVLILDRLDDDGREGVLVKVCDFGIASLAGVAPTSDDGDAPPASGPRGPRITGVGTVVGTPAYMSPEQARGEAATARSDIYSAGVVMYQMLTGRLPFEGADITATVLMQLTHAPEPPSVHRAGLGAALESVCLRALAKVPERRFPSARAMRAALREASAESVPPPASTPMVTASTFERQARAKADARNAETEVRGTAPARRLGRGAWVALLGATLLASTVAALFAFRSKGAAAAAATTVEPAPTAVDGTVGPLASVPEVVRGKDAPLPVAAARAGRVDSLGGRSGRRSDAREAVPPSAVATSTPQTTSIPQATSLPPAVAAASAPAHLRATVVSVAAVSRAPVAALVARAAVDGCFSGALSAAEMTHGTAHMDIDEDGVVRAVNVRLPPATQSAAACVRTRLVGKRLPQPPDTGSASAELDLAPVAN
ncbi:MAG: protein kinase [Polyangiaceae bacterium]|nr:protein kinase [Polyangiaceae bacterium]